MFNPTRSTSSMYKFILDKKSWNQIKFDFPYISYLIHFTGYTFSTTHQIKMWDIRALKNLLSVHLKLSMDWVQPDRLMGSYSFHVGRQQLVSLGFTVLGKWSILPNCTYKAHIFQTSSRKNQKAPTPTDFTTSKQEKQSTTQMSNLARRTTIPIPLRCENQKNNKV